MLLLTVATGCVSAGGPRERAIITHRLAEERAAEHRTSYVPTITLAQETRQVTRYVLDAARGGILYPRLTDDARIADAPPERVDASGTVELPISCPPELQGVKVVARILLAGSTRTEPYTCPPDGAPRPLRITRLTPGEEVKPVVLFKVAEAQKTRRLHVGPRAVLRLALGIVDAGESRVRFRIVARRADGHVVALLDRELDPATRPDERGWVEVEVPLAPATGATGGDIRLGFRATRSGGPEWRGTPAWGDVTIVEPRPERSPRPNVVLVSIDTLRADQVGFDGARRPTTPTLDRFAAEGTVFSSAVTQAPWTLPSHLTMLTGVYSCVHGRVTDAVIQRLTPGLRPLAQILAAEGYATASFNEDGYILPGVFQPGFDVFSVLVGKFTGWTDGIERTVGSARRWLASHAHSPFFLFLHTYQVHWPYPSPPPYSGMFGHDAGKLGPGIDAYDAALRYADATLGSFLAALQETAPDGTIVIVTSDHGEAFNEHGHIQHGNAMYAEVLRVPFLWRAPGLIASGRRVDALVGLIDIVPTILDLLGLPVPDVVQGRSLAPWLRPQAPPPPTNGRVLFAENSYKQPYAVAARAETWKAFFDADGRTRLFSLATDPDERDPMSGESYRAAAEAARARFVADCERVRGMLDGSTAPPPGTLPGPPEAEQKERLRALGYVE